MFHLIDIHTSTMNIKPEDLLTASTLHELRPIPNATESDNDPIDLFHEFTQPDSLNDTEDYIIITDDELDTSNPYNGETDIDSPLFRPKPNIKATQTSLQKPNNNKSTQTDQLNHRHPTRLTTMCTSHHLTNLSTTHTHHLNNQSLPENAYSSTTNPRKKTWTWRSL